MRGGATGTADGTFQTGGIALARGYYADVVLPLLHDRWPGLPHAAARLGSGSDVLGLDDAQSRDHDWGLRLTLLVDAEAVDAVDAHLEQHLPPSYAGLPTRFATTWEPVVRQRVEVASAATFVWSRLGVDPTPGLTAADWLALTGQSVLEVTAGPVFVDTDGALTRLREALTWYPDAVWRYVVAADWARLAQEAPLVGRTGLRGDDLGSRVVAARLVGVATHLAFTLARRWSPYPKWAGTVLAGLPVGPRLVPALSDVLTATDWRDRQAALAGALDVLAQAQRDAGLPTPDGPPTEQFYDRPVLGVRAAMAEHLLATVDDPVVRALPPGVGSVEQWVDNVDVLCDADRRVRAARAHATALTSP
jgi:hypothetical protein